MLTGHDNRTRWWRAGAVFVMAGALTVSGCSKSSESGSGTGAGSTTSSTAVEAQKVDEIAATVPENIRNAGKLVVGVNIPYAHCFFNGISNEHAVSDKFSNKHTHVHRHARSKFQSNFYFFSDVQCLVDSDTLHI